MPYSVIIQPAAEAELDTHFLRIAREAPENASAWLDGLISSIESLAHMPLRCSVAPESQFVRYEIRQLLYGRTGRTYRVLFTIVDDQVHILHCRHWGQRRMKPSEFRRA
ncbi:MAG: type II toxin-antitoxin system RelE/ParE family toxin [Acidobacteriota bacterium]